MAEKKQRPTVAGLSALHNAQNWQQLGKATDEAGGERLREARIMDITQLQPDPAQPRQNAQDANIDELAADIQARGILQPLLVRPVGDHYLIVAGERRYRAALQAELKEVPVLVRDLSDDEARMTSLVENIQRSDLDPEDEARYFQALFELGMSYRDIAAAIHKSHNYVGRRMRLLANPDHLLAYRQGLATLEHMGDEETAAPTATGAEGDPSGAPANPGTERTNFSPELKIGTERTSTDAAPGVDRPYATRKAPSFRPRRSLYRPFHQTITIVSRIKPDDIPQDERQGLLTTVDKLMEELEHLRRRITEAPPAAGAEAGTKLESKINRR